MKLQKRKIKYLVWGLCLSVFLGNWLAPLQYAVAESIVNKETPVATNTNRGWTNNDIPFLATGLPAPSTPSTPGATILPSATPNASASPTATPLLTPNPNATVRLGSQTSEKVKLTIGDQGVFDLDWNATNIFYANSLNGLTRVVYESSNSNVLSVTPDGSYQAVSVGEVTLTVYGYGLYGSFFEREYTVAVYPDMSNVTLDKTTVTVYRTANDYRNSSAKIKINSEYLMNRSSSYDEEESEITLSSSNGKMFVDFEIKNNVLTLSCGTAGSSKLTLTMYGKEFTIQFKVVIVNMSSTSLLLSQKQTKQLKVKGLPGKIKWKSSNGKVASVTSSGKVRAKKQGVAIIFAQFDDCKVGCAVSVTTVKKKKTIVRAQKIASTGQYSQAKRMQNGYYDCSSLVWRSYSPYGYRFGSASYAPPAANMAQWMAGRGKLVKGGYSRRNVEKLKLRAGDLLFETGASNGRYKGIYHVEMFIGYEFYGFDSKGKAIVLSKWANRPTGAYGYGCGIVGRP